MKVKIFYMSGAGNTFFVFKTDVDKSNRIDVDSIVNKIIQTLSVNYKIEGIMSVSASADSDFQVQYYNPDGSSGMMCGNGARCAVFFANYIGICDASKTELQFDMAKTIYKAEFTDRGIRLYFPKPAKELSNKSLQMHNNNLLYDFYDVGTEHICINIEHFTEHSILDNIDLNLFAKPIRHHKEFAPDGVNVNLYNVLSKEQIQLRTFEKGVEAETGACGTGAISTALSAYNSNLISFPVEIIPPSGESLWVDIYDEGMILEGPAKIVEELELEV